MKDLTPEPESNRTLVDALLEEQQSLTAVGRFARKHDSGTLPAQSRYYRELIPLEKPRPGEQYAFGVDLDGCTGCKASVSACHSLNGLEDEEIWRNVGFIHGGSRATPYQQTITTACHHCVDPACLNGCPVKAYEKDAETGIVRHLDDQCIGCQYCVLKCPYDVPKYSEKRGIVRKCDMCYNRLAANEAPACVQACPNGAITIRVVNQAELVESIHEGNRLLPDTFDSIYTKPTTAYTTTKGIPSNARASDVHALRLEHAHFPLIYMLVLTQIAAGIFTALAMVAYFGTSQFDGIKAPMAAIGFMILNVGLAASTFHLGRPLGAWRFFLGLRTSWMSREILAFSVFAAQAGATALTSFWTPLSQFIPVLSQVEVFINPGAWAKVLSVVTAVTALVSVYCSAMIYIDTGRAFWIRELTFPKFFGTTVLLGSGATACILSWIPGVSHTPIWELANTAALIATLSRVILFGWEVQNFRDLLTSSKDPNHRSGLIMWKLRRKLLDIRVLLFVTSMVLSLMATVQDGWNAAFLTTAAFALTALSQTIERYFYFTAVVAPRMPGGVTA